MEQLPEKERNALIKDRYLSETADLKPEDIKDLLPADRRRSLNEEAEKIKKQLEAMFK